MTMRRCQARDLYALTSRTMTDEGYLVAPAKLARPGEITGKQGQISLGFHPYDESTKRFLRSAGNHDQGRWSVTFEGQENFDFKATSDRSVSMRTRELRRSMEAPDLGDALSGFVKMLGDQALPQGYTFDVDLEKVPADRRGEAKAALAALSDYGAEVRYLDNDLNRMMDRFRRIGEIDRQLEPLVSKGREKWTAEEAPDLPHAVDRVALVAGQAVRELSRRQVHAAPRICLYRCGGAAALSGTVPAVEVDEVDDAGSSEPSPCRS